MAFSENLIRERRARNLSQEKLAELVGVSRQTVSQWENGYTEPDLTRLRRLAELFDLSLDELVEGPRPAKEEAAPEEPVGPWRWESVANSGVRTLAFEYRSRRTLFGLPLVHIHLGRGRSVATGILAIGNVARGAVAIGSVSAGLIAVGGVSAGLLFSLGGLAVGFLALGGLAVGYLALGGLAVGIYALGGAAIAANVAAGGAAVGPIAIGDAAIGEVPFDVHRAYPEGAVREAILQRFPGTLPLLADLFEALL